jgi:hypothetical protein
MYNQSSFQTGGFGVSGQKSFTSGNQVVSQYKGWQKPFQPTGQVKSVYGQNQQTHFISGQFNTNQQSYRSTGFPAQSQFGSGASSFQNTGGASYGPTIGNTAGIGSQGQMGASAQNYGSAYQGYRSGLGSTGQSQPAHSIHSWNQTQQYSNTPVWSQSAPTQSTSQFGYQSWNR